MVNIVTLENGHRYMVDVGFGGSGPIRPLPLLTSLVIPNILPQEMSLKYQSISETVDQNQKMWVFHVRNSEQDEWNAMYCFTEVEFLPQDYEVMKFWVCNSPQSWFTYRILVVLWILREGEIIGTLSIQNNELKQRMGAENLSITVCGTEQQRIRVFDEHFGIVLNEHEQKGISGMVTQL